MVASVLDKGNYQSNPHGMTANGHMIRTRTSIDITHADDHSTTTGDGDTTTTDAEEDTYANRTHERTHDYTRRLVGGTPSMEERDRQFKMHAYKSDDSSTTIDTTINRPPTTGTSHTEIYLDLWDLFDATGTWEDPASGAGGSGGGPPGAGGGGTTPGNGFGGTDTGTFTHYASQTESSITNTLLETTTSTSYMRVTSHDATWREYFLDDSGSITISGGHQTRHGTFVETDLKTETKTRDLYLDCWSNCGEINLPFENEPPPAGTATLTTHDESSKTDDYRNAGTYDVVDDTVFSNVNTAWQRHVTTSDAWSVSATVCDTAGCRTLSASGGHPSDTVTTNGVGVPPGVRPPERPPDPPAPLPPAKNAGKGEQWAGTSGIRSLLNRACSPSPYVTGTPGGIGSGLCAAWNSGAVDAVIEGAASLVNSLKDGAASIVKPLTDWWNEDANGMGTAGQSDNWADDLRYFLKGLPRTYMEGAQILVFAESAEVDARWGGMRWLLRGSAYVGVAAGATAAGLIALESAAAGGAYTLSAHAAEYAVAGARPFIMPMTIRTAIGQGTRVAALQGGRGFLVNMVNFLTKAGYRLPGAWRGADCVFFIIRNLWTNKIITVIGMT